MAKDGKEIKGLIDEIERPFKNAPTGAGDLVAGLRDRMDKVNEYVYTRHDYARDVSPLLNERLSIGPALLRFYVNQAKNALTDDLKMHLEPVGALKRHETAADKMEIFEGHTLLKLDPYGYIRDEMHHYQAGGFFYSAWLEMNEFIAPEQAKGEPDGDYAKRLETARKSWFPWTLKPKRPDTVAFAETDDREITQAVCRYKVPIYEVLERYGKGYDISDKGKREHVLNEHFGYLAQGQSQSADTGARDIFHDEVEVCVYADKGKLSHYVDMDASKIDGQKAERYIGLGDCEFDNPFGQVPLLIAEGVYNPGQPMAYRREPLIMSLILLEDQRAITKSYWASRAANPPQPYEQKVPPELMKFWAESGTAPPEMRAGFLIDKDGRPIIQRSAGELTTLTNEVDATQDKLFGVLSDEARIANPAGMLFDPEASGRMGDIPATTILAERDERSRLMASAKRSETNFFGRALDMIEHAMRNDLNKHREKGEPKGDNDWPYSFTTTGAEGVKGKKIERGQNIEVTPQDLDLEYVRTIEPVDTRSSTRAATIDQAEKRWAAGTILYDERLEMHGVENVTEFKQKKTEEQLYQLESIRTVSAARLRVAQYLSVMQGTPVEETLMAIPDEVLPSVAGPEAAGGSGVYQMASPRGEGITGADSVTMT